MYKINEHEDREKYVLLVPAMLDDHFPLLKYALYSRDFRPVILENEDGIVDQGLKYVNNDMCYPCILNVGQMIAALQSGNYPLDKTCLLMPTVGDSCRGSNYISALRKAVKAAGFPQVRVLSMNLKGLEQGNCVPIHLYMVWRALFAMLYGDMLMILKNQLRPYEREPGAVEACRKKWFDRLGEDLKTGKHLTLGHMKRNFKKISADFAQIPLTGAKNSASAFWGTSIQNTATWATGALWTFWSSPAARPIPGAYPGMSFTTSTPTSRRTVPWWESSTILWARPCYPSKNP